MIQLSKSALTRTIATIKAGGVGVMPTDTIYGIVASALEKNAVARVYRLRRRNPKKPMIILIGKTSDLRIFGIRTNADLLRTLGKFWPGRVSVVLELTKGDVRTARFDYLHRGGGSLAFRLPKPLWLRRMLQNTGPIVAPSANLEGQPPAKTIHEAKKYFGKKVDFYLNAGPLQSAPSTVLKVEKGSVIILRTTRRR